ncbi:MAG: formate/nitrite transporter family protein, partial [Muribaculaceae bacterium]|nr:formate/nitrite transporter family protein [Muribaculaceae bacterium]
PIGLVLVVVLGAELFTGNNALLIPAMRRGHFGIMPVIRNWILIWTGNFIGALAVAYFLVYLAGLTTPEPFHSAIIKTAESKSSLPWLTVFIRGIGANWCVCLAVWLALAGHTLTEKVIGCWIPVAAFVMLGYEHCVANMFFIPCGILEGACVDIPTMLWNNLLPATLGNIAGGALFVGTLHGYLRIKAETKQ